MSLANLYLEGHLLFLANQNNQKKLYKLQHILKQGIVISGDLLSYMNEAIIPVQWHSTCIPVLVTQEKQLDLSHD